LLRVPINAEHRCRARLQAGLNGMALSQKRIAPSSLLLSEINGFAGVRSTRSMHCQCRSSKFVDAKPLVNAVSIDTALAASNLIQLSRGPRRRSPRGAEGERPCFAVVEGRAKPPAALCLSSLRRATHRKQTSIQTALAAKDKR
jgi:hypothetical protein